MTDWTPTDDQYDIIMAFALQNVIEYDGKPQVGSIVSRIMSIEELRNQFRPVAQYLNAAIVEASNEAITIYDVSGRENSLEYLGELGSIGEGMLDRFQEMEGPKVKREQVLKELRNVEPGNFRVRFAPNPNAPLHIGHSRGVIINRAYADKYQGQFYLRLDDTGMGTKPPLAEAYDMIPEDIEWLTGRAPDDIFIASDRLGEYYFWAEELIKLGGAYVDTLSRDESAELKADGLPNPYRERPIDENLVLFDNMTQGDFLPGEAVLRIKSDPNAPDPAMRDFILFRIQIGGHPRQPIETCWPLLVFQSAIDDHLLDITHIIRGIDLQAEAGKQKLIYDFFGWQYPEVEYWGRVQMLEEAIDSKTGEVLRNQDGDVIYETVSVSSSDYAKGIQEGRYAGWADPQLYTVQGMRNRGYSPEAITQWWKDMGMNRGDIKAPLSTLDSLNSQFMKSEFESETFESNEIIDPYYQVDCLICARPFGSQGDWAPTSDADAKWASPFTFEEVKKAWVSASTGKDIIEKSAAWEAFAYLAQQNNFDVSTQSNMEEFIEVIPEGTYNEIMWTAQNTLKSKNNPFGVRKTARTLAYWWLIVIPVTRSDGYEVRGYYLDALNAYMSQYLVEGKKRSSIAVQTEAYLRKILVEYDRIGSSIMDIGDFGVNSATRRIPAFNPRLMEEFEANGATINPPPPPSDITDDDCVICGRSFFWSDLARSLSQTYYQNSDGGAVDMKSSKTMPEEDSLTRTTVNIAGQYLFKHDGAALTQYFAENKNISNNVVNLLRLALVPSIIANREMYQLVKNLQFKEETPFEWPTSFIEEYRAESFDAENSVEFLLESVKSAETLDEAKSFMVNYSGEGMMAENIQYLNSIVNYDYGSGKNAEFEIYGAPTLEDVQKFAEGLVNIQRFLGV
jgi:glutamyl-tRNA synthetase